MNISLRILSRAALTVLFVAAWAGVTGCQTTHPGTPAKSSTAPADPAVTDTAAPTNTASLVLHEGDTIHITFPGAHTLDGVQTIRRDGKITMEQIGEVTAAGLTPAELEKQLLIKYDKLLVDKEVTVSVQASEFVIYVAGAVMRPGKIIADRPLTPLEAVLEAGIDQSKANLKKVTVIRETSGPKPDVFYLNIKNVIKGKASESFQLKPLDKIFVPERFTPW